VAYLVAPGNLVGGHYYALFPGFADFGLTIDGAFALAATGTADQSLLSIAEFVDHRGTDGNGRSVNDWTGLGTAFASGGAVAKEALLAEVVGRDPRAFGGTDLIAAVDGLICAKASKAPDTSCAAAGNYTYAQSVFAQALGVIAQLRAGDTAHAAGPVAYLESLQHADGSWPSVIPAGSDSDVDSTATAVMALALVPGSAAADAVSKGVAWVAGQQAADGGFPGAAGDSTNSAALAVQALTLDATTHATQISRAMAFLAARQNPDGGFDVAAGGQPGSALRASAQAVGGAVGTSFGVLLRDLSGVSPSPSPSASPTRASPSPSHSTPSPSQASASASATRASSSAAGAVHATSTDPALAATGADLGGPGLVAGALLVAGCALVVAARLSLRRLAVRRH
jgi:hypothetical protein